MTLVCRPARSEDLEHADALVVGSINDLTVRHGLGAVATSRPPRFQQFSLEDDPAGLWVVEEEGRIQGFAFSWVCADLWFLAQLFVSPDQQGRGVGNALMRRTLEHATKAGATRKALITFAFNRVSQGLYIRHGLYPRLPLYLCTVARERLQGRPLGASLQAIPLQDTAADLRNLARIDAEALGLSREKHHRFLMGDSAMRGVALQEGGECLGYAYISSDGHIGPLAVLRADAMAAAFETALRLAADGTSASVSAFLPGTSEEALSLAVGHGMQIALPMVLMSSEEFGRWRQYLPRNPGFM